MEDKDQLIETLVAQQARMLEKFEVMQIDIATIKGNAKFAQIVAAAFCALIVYIYVGNNQSIEKWNYQQDNQIAANTQAIAQLKNELAITGNKKPREDN